MRFKDVYQDGMAVLAAPLPELAGVLLRKLNDQLQRDSDVQSAHNFLLEARQEYDSHDGPAQAFAEAWGWLANRDLIVQHACHGEGWFTLTRHGRTVAAQADFQQWLRERELPEDMLHTALRPVSLRLFRQGLFDSAAFEAFKALEVSIRDAAGLGHDLVGIRLVARAFAPDGGPLADMAAEAGERQSLLNLMTGAIGSYKNPQSHRHVGLDAAECREMLVIASHLLKIVDSRRPAAPTS